MPHSSEAPDAAPLPQVLLANIDAGLLELLRSWLAEAGWPAVALQEGAPDTHACIGLVIVEVPFPRDDGVDCVRRVARQYPGVPILALSSTFHPGIECHGPVARALGAHCVLPTPVSRDKLTLAVRHLLQPCKAAASPSHTSADRRDASR
jgi:DNA-binding response OmpR family regulator